VIRDRNGEFDVGELVVVMAGDEEQDGIETGGQGKREESEEEKERRRLAEAVKHHSRDRNRAPSEPAELLEAVKNQFTR